MSVHLFVESLTTLDSSYASLEQGLSGITYIVDIELEGQLNEEGMLLDFGLVKKSLKAQLEALADHILLIPQDLPGLHVQTLDDNRLHCQWHDQHNQCWIHQGPPIATGFIPCEKLTTKALEQFLELQLSKTWHSEHIHTISISLRKEHSEHLFQYSHGLRLHKGPCQRIAHGHSSKVFARTSTDFDPHISNTLAQTLNHQYLVDKKNQTSNFLNDKNLNGALKTTDQLDEQNVYFAYEAPEGLYELSIPQHRCIWLNHEVTIENIALYLLEYTRNNLSADIEEIRVYEGFHKGAIARNRP